MDISVILDDLDQLVLLIDFLKTIGKNPTYDDMSNADIFHYNLLHWDNLDTVETVYMSMDDGRDALASILTSLVTEIVFFKNPYKLENIELLMKVIMKNKLPFVDEADNDNEKNIFKLYDKTSSPVILDFIVYNLSEFPKTNYFIAELVRQRRKPIFKLVVQRLNSEIWEQNVTSDGITSGMNHALNKAYDKAMASSVLDTALGLRQTGLPSNVVENIASYAYDTTGFSLYQLMNIVSPVVEHRSKVWIQAGNEAGFKDFE